MAETPDEAAGGALTDDEIEEEMLAYLRTVVEKIIDYGWALQTVFDPDGDPAKMFTYTAGLTDRGLPELWIATLAPEQAGRILNSVAELVVDGLPPTPGSVVDAGWSTPFRFHGPCDLEAVEVGVAVTLAPGPVTLLQVLWPDTAGLYPGDVGYDEARFPQRLLPLEGVES